MKGYLRPDASCNVFSLYILGDIVALLYAFAFDQGRAHAFVSCLCFTRFGDRVRPVPCSAKGRA